jgi:hypothetical protein
VIEREGIMNMATIARVEAGRHAATEPRNPAVDRLRRHVLAALEESPGGVSDVPRAWPLVRAHVAATIDHLAEDGLLERAEASGPGGGPRLYRITAAGLRELGRRPRLVEG